MYKKLPLVDVTNRKSSDRDVPTWPLPQARSITRQEALEQKVLTRGTSLEQDPYNVIILNYTMKCPLACDYCCYSCGPLRTETMPLELGLKIIEQAAALGVFKEAGITGGDPMVLFDDMLVLAKKMHEVGLPFSMISACDWATDKQSTYLRLKPLVDYGMNVFTISQDSAHEKFVGLDNVRRAAEASISLGIQLVLCGSNYDDNVHLEERLPEYVGHPQVTFVNRVVLPGVGRSKHKEITPKTYPNADMQGNNACYKRVYHDVTVFWDGEVYPCCSVYNRETPGISCGNLYDSSLEDVWERIEGSLLLRTIKHGSFDELYEFVRQHDEELFRRLPDRAAAVGPCHLCNLLLGNSKISGEIKALYEHEEAETIRELLRAVSRRYGTETAEKVLRTSLT